MGFSLPVLSDMDGRVLIEIISGEVSPAGTADVSLPAWLNPDWDGAGPGQDALDRMRALGYLGDSDD